MKSIGNPKTFRRLHNDTSASDRLESLNIFPSLQKAARSHLLFDWVASSLYLGGLEDPSGQSIMESSQADDASLKVTPFQSQIFLIRLRFHQLYAYMTLFSSTSNFLSNDVGCGNILIGRQKEKESWANGTKQGKKEGKATSGAGEKEGKE